MQIPMTCTVHVVEKQTGPVHTSGMTQMNSEQKNNKIEGSHTYRFIQIDGLTDRGEGKQTGILVYRLEDNKFNNVQRVRHTQH